VPGGTNKTASGRLRKEAGIKGGKGEKANARGRPRVPRSSREKRIFD